MKVWDFTWHTIRQKTHTGVSSNFLNVGIDVVYVSGQSKANNPAQNTFQMSYQIHMKEKSNRPIHTYIRNRSLTQLSEIINATVGFTTVYGVIQYKLIEYNITSYTDKQEYEKMVYTNPPTWIQQCSTSEYVLKLHCLVLVGSSNGFECEFTIELKQMEGLMKIDLKLK